MDTRRRRFAVEELEARTLLSTAFTGTLHGQYLVEQVHPGAKAAYAITGSGKIEGLGQVSLKGAVHASGRFMPGGMAGELTLANARGALTLALEASPAGETTALPDQFDFQVLRGTGAYRHLSVAGTIALQLGTATHLALTIQPTIEQLPSPQPTPSPQPVPAPIGTSEIYGSVEEGPIFPVSRPGEINSRPVPGAIICVQPSGGGPEITQATADAMGNFQILLPSGAYRIVALPPNPSQFLPRGIPQDIVLGPNQVLQLTLEMDTGIR
jgi:hypothetical protein